VRLTGRQLLKHVSEGVHGEKRWLVQGMDSLPPDVLNGASRRLALSGLILAGMTFFYLFIYSLLPLLGGPQISEPFGTGDVIIIGALLMCLGVFFLARTDRISPQRKLDIGLLFEIVLGFIVGVLIRLPEGPMYIPGMWGISEMCTLILIFPVIVPNTPWKILMAALLTASMDPLGVWAAVASGKTIPPDTNLFMAFFSNYLCAGLALVPSYILNHLSRQVGYAREMGSYRLTDRLGHGGMGEV